MNWLVDGDGEPRIKSKTRLNSLMLFFRRLFHIFGTSRSRISLGESRGEDGGRRCREGSGVEGADGGIGGIVSA